MGGVAHFGISEGKEGLKHGSRPWLGVDIFWNCPFCLIAPVNSVFKLPNRQLIFFEEIQSTEEL